MSNPPRKSSRQKIPTAKGVLLKEAKNKPKSARSRHPKPTADAPKKGKKRQIQTSEDERGSASEEEADHHPTTRKDSHQPAKRQRRQSKSSIATEEVDEAPVEEEEIEEAQAEPEDNETETDKSQDGNNRQVIQISDSSQDELDVRPAPIKKIKKRDTRDLLMLFSDRVKVFFKNGNGDGEQLVGRWCNECKNDDEFIRKKGKRRAFHVGGNSLCRQHIRSHYQLYKERCARQDIVENPHAVPRDLLNERREAKRTAKKQTSLDGVVQTAPGPKAFSRDDVLKTVAEFVVCDDQSLLVVEKATFRNCLVAMRPTATHADLPSKHDLSTFIHNSFVSLLNDLKAEIQSPQAGRVSVTMDLWSVDQTKAAFFGLTAHWIHTDPKTKAWSLRAQVVAFRGISGPHTGENIGRYFLVLTERVGIISKTSSKLLCITADNTGNNDTTCDVIERSLHERRIYNFDPTQHRLPCLAHVLNLAIIAIMSSITQIGSVKTATAIWEFDPSLPDNRVLGDSLDVVSAIRTLAVKIQSSGQRIEYFETLQARCGIEHPLIIPLHSNIRWGTADGMLARSYLLRQAINLFLASADHLYGPITTIRQNNRVIKRIPWTAFSLRTNDWERVNDTRTIIADANDLQQYFSDEERPTLFRAIPAFEEIQTAWEAKEQLPKFTLYKTAVSDGLAKLGKYYKRFDDKPVYILALVLHPYYKMDYIKMQWGGAEEQARERAAGNPNAVNWHDEAMKVVERVMEEYWTETEEASAKAAAMKFALPVPSTSATKVQASIRSEFDEHRRKLIEQASKTSKNSLGWAAELRRYLKDLLDNVTKDMDVIKWWSKHADEYPTLARIAQDICAIPASSVPCERLFSSGSEIATDRRSRLSAEKFEELQLLKHAWRHSIVDRARENSQYVEEVEMDEFKELLAADEEFALLDRLDDSVEVVEE